MLVFLKEFGPYTLRLDRGQITWISAHLASFEDTAHNFARARLGEHHDKLQQGSSYVPAIERSLRKWGEAILLSSSQNAIGHRVYELVVGRQGKKKGVSS